MLERGRARRSTEVSVTPELKAGYVPGLAGVVAARTRLSHVGGEAGRLIIAGFPLEEIAYEATFEEVVFLLRTDRLPGRAEFAEWRSRLAAQRALPAATLPALRSAATLGLDPMAALAMAATSLGPRGAGDEALETDAAQADALIAGFPPIVAAFWRLRAGREPISPRPDLGHAANYLYMLSGEIPDPAQARALEVYLNTVVDHGLNASTFAARVIASTGADLAAAVSGAIGALKGPAHGGAPGPVLAMLQEIGTPERARRVLQSRLERGERLMGFGHRVYRVRDPRAEVLATAAADLLQAGPDTALLDLAREVEKTAVELLAEHKPGRRIETNVEFYTALLLQGLGIEAELFSPTFAISRVAGWVAHVMEQREEGRLFRPRSEYVGAQGRRWVPLAER